MYKSKIEGCLGWEPCWKVFCPSKEEMNDQETLLKQVFGESSDSDSDDCEQPQQHENRSENFGQTPSWLRIKEINGLYLCVDFLSPQHQSSLLSAIQNGAFSSLSCFI